MTDSQIFKDLEMVLYLHQELNLTELMMEAQFILMTQNLKELMMANQRDQELLSIE